MAAVGAALKKIAVAIISNPRSRKAVGGIILGIIIIVVTPFAAIVAVFNGDIEIEQNRLNEIIQQNSNASLHFG